MPSEPRDVSEPWPTPLCLGTALAWLQRAALAQAVAVKAVGGKEGGQVIAGL